MKKVESVDATPIPAELKTKERKTDQDQRSENIQTKEIARMMPRLAMSMQVIP
jgi:hypothetical protein